MDDATVPQELWIDDPVGTALWNAFAHECTGDPVRLVSPVYEQQRCDFAQRAGLAATETWWLLELPDSSGGSANIDVDLPGAQARTTAAPPIYAPPGPMLYVSNLIECRAVPAAVHEASQRGCSGVIVSLSCDDPPTYGDALAESGLRPHCEYYAGSVAAVS